MKKFLIFILCIALLIPTGVGNANDTVSESAWRELYVSASGKADGDGSKENPFPTIEKTQQAVRLLSEDQQGDIVVNVLPGEYELSEPLFFKAEDSGKNGHRIIFRGDKKNPPLISGGKKVTGFEIFDEQRNIYRVSVPDMSVIREMYINGERRYVAQTNGEIPAEKKPEVSLDYYTENPRAPKNDYTYYNPDTVYQYDGFYVSKKYIDIFENQENIEIFWSHEYRELILHVDEIKQDPTREDVVIVTVKQNAYDLLMKDPGYFNPPPLGKFWVRNAYELLDTPGEFYFNEAEKMLYYMPYADEDLSTAEVTVPRLERLVSLVGNNDDDRVKNISFEYLEFAYSTWLSHIDTDWYTWQGPESGLYTSTRVESAIRVFISDNIDFTGNVFHSIASSVIDMNNNVINSDIIGNCFYDIGGTTVHVGSPNARNYFVAATRALSSQQSKNGELLNLLTDVDSSVSASFYGEADDWKTTRSRSMHIIGTLRGGKNGHNYQNGFYPSFVTTDDYNKFKGAWISDPYAPENGEKSWVRYDMRDKYTLEEITLIFDTDATDENQRKGFEVLLSNDRFFTDGSYYKVAQQDTDAGANVTYSVNSDAKYRFLMIRTIGATPLALTSAVATTKDRTTFYQYGECKNINIENNYMERINLDFPNSTGLFINCGNNIEVNHNYIKDTPYSGMSLGWSWGKGSQATYDEHGNYVAGNSNGLINASFNRVEKTAQQGNDGGGIYTLGGFQKGSSVHDNYIYDTGIGMNAYYLDNGTSRIDVYNNVAEDVFNFTSASYADDGEDIHVYDNYSTNSKTKSREDPNHKLQNVYTWGQYPEKVYDIIRKAGLEKEYEYLADIPCKGRFNLLDADTVYNNGDRTDFVTNISNALIESAKLVLTEGKFGDGLGEYPYSTYYKLEAELKKFEELNSFTTSDVFKFRELLKEAGRSVNRKTPSETLLLCEKLIEEASTYEKNPVEGSYSLKALEEFKKQIENYKALSDKESFAALKMLEDAYNSFLESKVRYAIDYIYADGMTDVSISENSQDVTMYFDLGDNLREKTVQVHSVRGGEIADTFEKRDISDGLEVPIYNNATGKHKIVNVKVDFKKNLKKTQQLSENSFLEAKDDEKNVYAFKNGVMLTPCKNAVVSSFSTEKNGLNAIKLTPLSSCGQIVFSLLLGVDSEKVLYKNAKSESPSYVEIVFENGYVSLYFVEGISRTFIDKIKHEVVSGKQYNVSYSVTNTGADTAVKLLIDDNIVFDKLVNGNVDSQAWGYYSENTPVYCE